MNKEGGEMKIKVGDTVYDGENEPIMVILTEKDKQNIANMLPEATRYCQFPGDKFTLEQIDVWMGPGEKIEER
jgi:hypothetical protein